MKRILKSLYVDIVGGLLVAIGVYNFAVAAEFPLSGVSGFAVVFYHFWGLPIGFMTFLMNVPIILACYRILGKHFILKSMKTIIISTIMMDYVAPLFPIYRGELLLSCICMGVLTGLGYGLIYKSDTSTGGADFVILSIHAKKPYLSVGKLNIILESVIVVINGILTGGNVDKIICGMIATYLMSVMIDKAMYGINAGKMTLVVTGKGEQVAKRISEMTKRGATLLQATGSYTGKDKKVVMCACSNKQMHQVQDAVKEVDENAFLIILESNEVRGEGFNPY